MGDAHVQGPDDLSEWSNATLSIGGYLESCDSCPDHEGFARLDRLCFKAENGVVHSDHGPAIYMHDTHPNGRAWVRRGKLHRDDGPAVKRPPRSKPRLRMPGDNSKDLPVAVEEWWLNGHPYRPDEPAIVWDDGRGDWYNIDGELHRDGDEPAVEYPRPYGEYEHGPDRYYKRGLRHRKFGPAVLGFPGRQERYVFTDAEPDQYYFYGVDLNTVDKLDPRTVWLRMRNHVSAEADVPGDEFYIDPRNAPAWRDASEQGVALYTNEFHEEAVRLALLLSPN